MTRHVATFYVGHNVDGVPTWSHGEDVLPALAKAFPDGFTAWEATGGWCGGMEKTTVAQVVGLPPGRAAGCADLLRRAFMQTEVLCTVAEVEVV